MPTTCTSAFSFLPLIIGGLTQLDCTTSPEILSGILAELQRLDLFVDCDTYLPGTTCPEDRLAIAAALDALRALPIAFGCPSPVQSQLEAILRATAPLMTCSDIEIENDEPDPPITGCTPLEWDRLSPAPAVGGSCEVLALTTSSGTWESVGDRSPLAVIPGASSTSFSAWERSFDDFFRPLQPASQMLGRFGLSTSQIGFLQADPSMNQLYAAVDLRPLQSRLAAADHVVVMYGRNNAAAAYVDDGDGPFGFDPGAHAKYLLIQDYEHEPRRDSIKLLTCSAQQLLGRRSFTLSSRVAVAMPFIPYVPARPGVWAAILACAPDQPTRSPTTPPSVPSF